jgi:hypothetical protein
MVIKYGMRFPEDLYTRIAVAADREGRSIHGQILWILDQALPPLERTPMTDDPRAGEQ